MKKTIKKLLLLISSILYHDKQSKIIYYHDVYGDKQYTNMGTPLNLFAQHIKVIRKAGFIIKNKIQNYNNEVMICFDDGFHGIYDTKQFFIDNDLHPTVFLAVSLIGKPGYLNNDEIIELQNEGFIFQCHAWSHSDLTMFSKEELQHELNDSKKILTSLLGKTIDQLCFPLGYFSELVLDECKRYGYKVLYSSIPGDYYDNLSVGNVRTRNLAQFADCTEVRLILHGGNNLLRNRYLKQHWRK